VLVPCYSGIRLKNLLVFSSEVAKYPEENCQPFGTNLSDNDKKVVTPDLQMPGATNHSMIIEKKEIVRLSNLIFGRKGKEDSI